MILANASAQRKSVMSEFQWYISSALLAVSFPDCQSHFQTVSLIPRLAVSFPGCQSHSQTGSRIPRLPVSSPDWQCDILCMYNQHMFSQRSEDARMNYKLFECMTKVDCTRGDCTKGGGFGHRCALALY